MPRKKKKEKRKEEKDIENEFIIGYNSKREKTIPPKKKKKKAKIKKEEKNKETINETKNTKGSKNKIQNIKSVKTQKKPPKKKKGKLRKILKILLKLIIVIGILAGIIAFLFVSPVFEITEIVVNGSNEISESVYIAMSGIELGDNIFSIDKNNIIITMKKEPYVESVEIKNIYPNKIEINAVERKISYLAEQDSKYYYLDKNGYLLETNLAPLDYLIIKGCITDFGKIDIGGRIEEGDISKFNDLIKIVDAVENNNIEAKLNSINIENSNDYILEFEEEKKTIMLGDASNISAKMAWVSMFIREKKGESGIIHLNVEPIFFSPKE